MSEHAVAAVAHAKSGDLVLLDYELWTESGGKNELIDTSRAEVAEKENFTLPAGYEFGPRPHIIGGEDFPAALETAIAAASVGHEVEKELAPAEAFGERDPNLIDRARQFLARTSQGRRKAFDQLCRPFEVIGIVVPGLQRTEQCVIFQPMPMGVAELLISGAKVAARAGAEVAPSRLEDPALERDNGLVVDG